MSKFLDKLVVIDNLNGTWTLHDQFAYQSDLGGLIVVPCGFKTDFASAPAPLWWMQDGTKCDGPGVVHDFLYYNGSPSRSKCDAILREALICAGNNRFRAWVMWAAVRSFGWLPWANHAKKRKKREKHEG